MFYIPPILVVSTFSQHIILSLYECGVLLCQCLSVYIFAMCKYMLSDFRKRISILLVILVLSFAFIHISCVIQMVWDVLVLCFYIELSSNKIFRMTASTLSTCVTAKILNLSSLEQLQHVLQWLFPIDYSLCARKRIWKRKINSLETIRVTKIQFSGYEILME